MRLIDADALFEVLKGEEEYLDGEGLESRADGIRDAIMDVISAPTIEQVNVTIDEDLLARAIEHRRKSEARKKGKWLEECMDYGECSECGFYGLTTDYCPSCGARMNNE